MKHDIYEKFNAMVVDADTALFRAAVAVQENYVKVTHEASGTVKEFSTVTEFWGHHLKKDGGWLRKTNDLRESRGQSRFYPEDFTVEALSRPDPGIDDHVEAGVKHFGRFIKHLRDAELAHRYKFLIGGEGNYRDALAKTREYKGGRKPKPLYFQEIRQALLDKWGRHFEVVDGKEVDDQMAVYGFENLKHFKATGEWLYLLAYVDKDLRMISSPAWNYDRPKDGVKIVDTEEAARWYCKQLLMGDKTTDNIQGLTDVSQELRDKYGLRNGTGVGEKLADDLLSDCLGVAEMFERVCEAYRSHYGDDWVTFTDWQGVEREWHWYDFLQETAMLIYMNPLEDPTRYRIKAHLKRLGVEAW